MQTYLVLLCPGDLIIFSLWNVLMTGRSLRWPTKFPSPLVYITWIISRAVDVMGFTPWVRLCFIGTIDLRLGDYLGKTDLITQKTKFSPAGHRRGVWNLQHEKDSVPFAGLKMEGTTYQGMTVSSRSWVRPWLTAEKQGT